MWIIFLWDILYYLRREKNARACVYLKHILFICVYVYMCDAELRAFMHTHKRASGANERECEVTSELNHVRNGWWARLGFGELAGFIGRWFYERIRPIYHTLTSSNSSSPRQGKGSRIASDIFSPILFSRTMRQPGSQTTSLGSHSDLFFMASAHRAFLISLRELLTVMAGRPSWFYTVKVFRKGTFVRLICTALKALLTHQK